MAPRKKSSPEEPPSHVAVRLQHDDIASLAYQYFLKRGCIHGLDLDDWLQAERNLLAKDAGRLPAQPKPDRRRKSAGATSAR